MDLVAYWQQHCAPFIRARFGRSERGASLVEYALLVALFAVVCIVAITVLGKKVSTRFSSTASSLLLRTARVLRQRARAPAGELGTTAYPARRCRQAILVVED